MSFPAILVLEDGSIIEGNGFGAKEPSVGEIVFNTSMSGYQEIITDPSYAKQIIAFTHPHIGNTGINDEDNESDSIFASGIVIKDLPEHYSNWRASQSLESFLEAKNTIGISNIDTRALTAKLRDHGALKACIAPGDKDSISIAREALNKFSGLEGLDLAKEVSTQNAFSWDEGTWPNYQDVKNEKLIIAVDFGVKKNILRLLRKHVGKVEVVNAQISFDELMKLKPDGVFLSNGPGDPEPCDYAIKLIQQLLNINIPIFGICLGHQLLALSGGCKTYKMKFGHHGGNHPVQDLATKVVSITSQNHGFAVELSSLPENIEPTHISLFDKSLQGIAFKDKPAFSFQGHPEASPGPHELEELFTKFNLMIETNAKKN
ncbi:glutamine-hydrolyzing carbamoyl-phosphate synthase small subunit [Gammaproteobacteria bacterium]|nr:glutamine-hydrolyzing carbamoyl-phosphate synthase small subunit [Gammaproteobacteria bacterium]MDC3228661.1 glutamine-hydrolyzing carbamoyl-phosphate synthase small subunit [Gammaproteobacteria bacterium]